jgi:hypothetical protein
MKAILETSLISCRFHIFFIITTNMFFSPLEQFDTVPLFSLSFFGYADISFTSVVFPAPLGPTRATRLSKSTPKLTFAYRGSL